MAAGAAARTEGPVSRARCRCRTYPWPHRPAGGLCRHPDPPLAVFAGAAGQKIRDREPPVRVDLGVLAARRVRAGHPRHGPRGAAGCAAGQQPGILVSRGSPACARFQPTIRDHAPSAAAAGSNSEVGTFNIPSADAYTYKIGGREDNFGFDAIAFANEEVMVGAGGMLVPIPEPASLALLALGGLAVFGGWRHASARRHRPVRSGGLAGPTAHPRPGEWV